MSYQYYPTPAKTAALMWSKFKRPIGVICDPSAGEGHLFRHAQDGFQNLDDCEIPWLNEVLDEECVLSRYRVRLRERARYKFREEYLQFLAVEIDPSHHANLREMGGTILGYDFMEVESLATVSQVIMNPPFAEGAKHVLHAWKIVYDAEIVAIVNAETIRNPYSQERRALVDLIEKHGSVEFLQCQFVGEDVERKTDVEIALIYLEKKPETQLDIGSILGRLKKEDEIKGPKIDPEVSQALALPENIVENTYHRFRIAVDAARKAAEFTAMAEKASSQLGVTLAEMQAKGIGKELRDPEELSPREAANKAFQKNYRELKNKAWAQIIRSSLLTNKLSNQVRKKLESDANEIYELEFSVANIHGFLAGLFESMGDIYAEMVCGLFDTIIGRSSDNVVFYKTWKSNEKHRFGMRIRRTRFIISGFDVTFRGLLTYESESFLADIDKVFGYLHGISERYDGLVQAFNEGRHKGGERAKSRFFDYRFYENAGTMHFYPNSMEVVEKLNRFVGGYRKWLPSQMNEANADFKKQYDEAEKLTKEYEKIWAKSQKGKSSLPSLKDQDACKTMAECIDKVHLDRGLHCGPLIATAETMVQISASASIQEERGTQLLLLSE